MFACCTLEQWLLTSTQGEKRNENYEEILDSGIKGIVSDFLKQQSMKETEKKLG